MLRIRYSKHGTVHTLILKGHAGYDEHGKDIVCAGASAIVYTLLGWLENNAPDHGRICGSIEPGDTWLRCDGGEKTAVAFEMAYIGLGQIAKRYPEFVKLESAEPCVQGGISRSEL